MRIPSAAASQMATTRSAWGYGSGSKRIGLTALKIAVPAPMPSASVSTLNPVNAGLPRSRRAA
jgi:hypothetical protein